MIAGDISSAVLAPLMGHESSTITERRYIHLFDRQRTGEAVRRAIASALADPIWWKFDIVFYLR